MKLRVVVAGEVHEAVAHRSVEALRNLPEAANLDIEVQRTAPDRVSAGSTATAVLDARYWPSETWARAALDSRDVPAYRIGGCVAEPLHHSLLDWAKWFSEYAHAAPPLPAGEVRPGDAWTLPDGNLLHLPGAARTAWREPGMLVHYEPPSLSAYLRENYRFSRRLMGGRRAGERLLLLISRPLAPVGMLVRLGRHAWRIRRTPRALLVSPWLVLFALVKTAGQIHGLARGR